MIAKFRSKHFFIDKPSSSVVIHPFVWKVKVVPFMNCSARAEILSIRYCFIFVQKKPGKLLLVNTSSNFLSTTSYDETMFFHGENFFNLNPNWDTERKRFIHHRLQSPFKVHYWWYPFTWCTESTSSNLNGRGEKLCPQPNFGRPGFLPGKLEFYNHIAVLPDKTACHLWFSGGDAGHCHVIRTKVGDIIRNLEPVKIRKLKHVPDHKLTHTRSHIRDVVTHNN